MVAVSGMMRKWAITAAAGYLGSQSQLSGCDVSSAVLPLPAGQTTLQQPTNESAHFIGVAFGVQNYTCSSANTYTSVGAVAELFDISCYYGSPLFNIIQEPLFEMWSKLPDDITVQEAIEFLPSYVPVDLILAQHYFINTTGVLSPTWDFRASQRFHDVGDALFVGKSRASLPDPVNATESVAWLDVEHVSGDIAAEVFRVSTVGGQPPTTCTSGTSPDIHVKYTSQYWFFGGSLN
jgi:hypothetical protein